MKSLFSIFCMLALTVLTVSGQEADTTIVLNYGPMPVGNITVSKSSATYRQVKEAEAVVEGLTDQKAKNRAVVSYVLSHPDSEGSVLLLNHVAGVSNGRKCLSAISEQARSGLMKPLYDAFSDGFKEFDSMTAKTREAIVIGKEAKDFTLEDVREIWSKTEGVTIQDDPDNFVYPMPLYSLGKDDVFVGRLRRDPSVKYGLNFWCVSDNIRKGAATNAVQIAEVLLQKGWL